MNGSSTKNYDPKELNACMHLFTMHLTYLYVNGLENVPLLFHLIITQYSVLVHHTKSQLNTQRFVTHCTNIRPRHGHLNTIRCNPYRGEYWKLKKGGRKREMKDRQKALAASNMRSTWSDALDMMWGSDQRWAGTTEKKKVSEVRRGKRPFRHL